MKKRLQKTKLLERLRLEHEERTSPQFSSKALDKEPTELLWETLYNLKKHILFNRRLHDDGND